MKKSQLIQIIKEEIFKQKLLNKNNFSITESQQLESLEQQAKDFVSKYGKVKIKI